MPTTPTPPLIRSRRPGLRVVSAAVRPAAVAAPASRAAHDAAGATTARIVASITAAIAERRLLPGTRLAEQKLADLFGVSRTLVRRALHQLARERLVRLEPARGAWVASPSIEEARQVFQARRLIEAAVVRQLARTITAVQVAELRRQLNVERAAIGRIDISGPARRLADFHVALARMSGNDVLAQVLAELMARSSLIVLLHQRIQAADALLEQHDAIVDALQRRDARGAVRLMLRHLRGIEHQLGLAARRPELALVSSTP